MTSISSTLKLFDKMTKPLREISSGVDNATYSMNKLSNIMNRNTKLHTSLNSAKGAADRFNNSQKRLNNELEKGSKSVSNLTSKVSALAGAYIGFESIKLGITATDNYTNQSARLELINDGLYTQAQLQEKIYNAAQRSRAVYGDSVASIAKLGLLAGDAFSNNEEVIQFTELMNKSFKVSGASLSEASNGMYQLTQAMASGRLMGDEFRSIMENAPMLAQAIADYTGVSMGELRKLSSEGVITSDIIKNALLTAGDEINQKFESMPKTFSDVWVSIKNTATMQFSEIMKTVNGFLNSSTGSQVVEGITIAIGALCLVVGFALNLIGGLTTFIVDNWGIIGPIVWTVVGALLAYNAALLIGNIITGISNTLKFLHATYTGIQTVAIGLATGAQLGFNAALAACPLTWIIALIIGLIMAVAALIAYCEPLRNAFADCFKGIADTVSAAFGFVVQVIENTLNWIIDKINSVLSAINTVTGAVAGLWGGTGTSLKIDSVDLGSFKKAGQSFITGVGSKGSSAIKSFSADNIKSAISGFAGGGKNVSEMPKFNSPKLPVNTPNLKNSNGLGGVNKGLKGANGHLSNIEDGINIGNEHLELMRDLAEKESVQNFVSLTPTVQVTTGPINKEVDINTVIDKIEKFLSNEVKNSVEGVYA